VDLVEVDPLETCNADEWKKADWYESKMRANLKRLADCAK
jgi:hypothetical protein